MDKNSNKVFKIILVIVFVWLFLHYCGGGKNDDEYVYSDKTFNIISSSENAILDGELREFARKNKFDIHIEYDDTLKITKRLNAGERYDAVWLSNSIWMYMIDTKEVKISDTKSTSINPIVLGIKKAKAEELGFIGNDVYSKDIVEAIESKRLKFTMSNPTSTNTGASAYLGILTTLAGNPEVLTKEMLENEELKEKLRVFFSGVTRSSGSEDYLEESFIKGDYEAVFTYESSIININKKLIDEKKEPLYAIYPIDGVSISDSPIGYIDQRDEKKKETYDKLVEFLVSNDGQKILASYGRRTWFGGINNNVDKTVFNPEWGIDTTKYISPVKYPSTAVIKQALLLYQTSLRKPVHVVFCLDYSGSMYGTGYNQLVDAMDYILTDRAMEEMIQFSDGDIIDVVPFNSTVRQVWHASNVDEINELLNKIKNETPNGTTALYPAARKGLELLKDEDRDKYNTSIILMTDGAGNVGYYSDVEDYYNKIDVEIPIYSIMFASASERQLNLLAELTNGKVFDGTTDLVEAFKEVRGYN